MRSNINLYNVDCMGFMKDVPDNYYDLAIVDPPYGIGAGSVNFKNGTSKNKTIGYRINDWDNKTPNETYFEELFRVSKNQIIWGANYMVQYLYPSHCWLFWDKGTGDNSYADGELAWTSFSGALRKVSKTWVGANAKDGLERIHPTQKPIYLYKWILDKYAKDGDKILDTHGGSMSIAIACHDMKFDLDLCELDKDYFEAGKKRLIQHQSQTQLF